MIYRLGTCFLPHDSQVGEVRFFMIRRFFTLSLVLLMLANQGLCLAHMHHGHDGGEPEDHDSRPHFHLGRHVHHQGGHADEHGSHQHDDGLPSDGSNAALSSDEQSPTSPCNFPLQGDHDSDAVYGEPVTPARMGSSGSILPDKDVVAGLACVRVEHLDSGLLHAQPSVDRSSFLSDDACPIYLRALSLRL